MIIGWQFACHMRTDLVLDALRMALGIRQPGADLQLVAHTDHGSQYMAEDYTHVLSDHLVLASVGSVGDCYDNALSESFVDSYKTELIADRVWRTNAQLELQTVTYVGWLTTAGCTPRSPTGRPSNTNASTGCASRSGSNRSRLRPPQQSPIYETL